MQNSCKVGDIYGTQFHDCDLQDEFLQSQNKPSIFYHFATEILPSSHLTRKSDIHSTSSNKQTKILFLKDYFLPPPNFESVLLE